MEYIKDGLKHMQLKFYIEGAEPGLKGIVHSESKEVCVVHLQVGPDRLEPSQSCVSFVKCTKMPKSQSTFLCDCTKLKNMILLEVFLSWAKFKNCSFHLSCRILKLESMSSVIYLWRLTPTQDGPSSLKTTDEKIFFFFTIEHCFSLDTTNKKL